MGRNDSSADSTRKGWRTQGAKGICTSGVTRPKSQRQFNVACRSYDQLDLHWSLFRSHEANCDVSGLTAVGYRSKTIVLEIEPAFRSGLPDYADFQCQPGCGACGTFKFTKVPPNPRS